MQFIGQSNNLEIINNWKEVPPFVIIQGDEHTGKNYFVLYLCKQFNLKYVKIENKVSDIRSLIEIMIPGSGILYHLDNFHTASLAAKNALLKITEEPIPGNYIVITGGPQLKTLESRARKILMEPFSNKDLKDYMRPYFPEEDVQNALIEAGINSPAKINYYKAYEPISRLIGYAYDVSERITCIYPDMIFEVMSKFENRYDEIDSFLLFLNILINLIENKVVGKRYYPYDKILEILISGKQELVRQPTLKRKLLAYKIFYQLWIVCKDG